MGRAVGAHDGIVTCGVTGQVDERCCSGIGLVGSSVLVDWYGRRERERETMETPHQGPRTGTGTYAREQNVNVSVIILYGYEPA